MLSDRFANRNSAPANEPGSGTLLDGFPPSAESVRQQPDNFDIGEYWRLLLKHRLVILGSLLTALVIGVVVTMLTTPLYTATTRLQIDREAARVLNVEDVTPRESPFGSEEFFQTQYGLLKSRSLAERVVDTEGLATSDAFIESMGVQAPQRGDMTAAQHTQLRRRLAASLVMSGLRVSPVRGSRLVDVSFESPDPALSQRLVNAIATNFIQATLDRRYESSSYVREFLEQQIAQTKTRLEEAERGLETYAANASIINLDSPSGQGAQSSAAGGSSLATSNLVTINAALGQATAARVAAEEKWRAARGAQLFSLPEVLENQTIQALQEEQARVEAEYQQKLRIYLPDFPEMQQLQARIDELEGQVNSLASGVRQSIRIQYEVALNEERSLQRQVTGLTSEVLDQRNLSVDYNILKREVDTSRATYDTLLKRYNEVGVTGGVQANNISIVDQAEAPGGPSSPNMLINLALAALLGLGFGVCVAFLLEALDESLATPDDVESKLGLSVLGVIPLLNKGEAPLEALADLRSPFAEAYYSLRTALQFSTPNGTPATLLVTSSRPAEGKSTTAYSIAVNLARVGKRVLLADGDLRNPSMHRLIGVDNAKGVSNLLAGVEELSGVAVPTNEPGLDFIPCGPLPPNPAELWGGDRLLRVLVEATQAYDHVIIDGPPVLGFADAPILAANVSGTVFVLEAGGTRRAQARGALRRLTMGRGRIIGAVLSKFNTKTLQYGGYDYAYDYSYGQARDSEATDKVKKAARAR